MGVEYPFSGDDRTRACGYPHLYLDCNENQTSIDIQGVVYDVLDIDKNTQILHIVRVDLLDGLCLEKLRNNITFYLEKFGYDPRQWLFNTTFDLEKFEYAPESAEITLHYDCPPPAAPETILGLFTCPSQSAFKNDLYKLNLKLKRSRDAIRASKLGS